MKKKGISPLIATVFLVGLTIFLSIGIFVWTRNTTEELQDKAFSQPIEADFSVEFKGVETCDTSDNNGLNCYNLLITNNEDFGVKFLITTITNLGMEVENPDEYTLGPFESKTFTIYYGSNLGNEDVEAKVEIVSLN